MKKTGDCPGRKKFFVFISVLFLFCLLLLAENPEAGTVFAGEQNLQGSFAGNRNLQADFAGNDASGEIDIDGLSEEIRELAEDYPYPDFARIFQKLLALDFKEAAGEVFDWMSGAAAHEISSFRVLMAELIGIVIFSAVFSNIAEAFGQHGTADSGFFVSYVAAFSIIFTNFTIMSGIFKNTVERLSAFLKVLLPAYTLSISLSGNLNSGVIFYEYFMIIVLVMNWICQCILLPLIQYYLLLELLNHFSVKTNISRLCESLYILLSKGIHGLFFLFFGLHLLETMLVPSVDAARNTVVEKLLGVIPGAGSLFQSVTGTVLGSGILIKNTLGVTAILFILVLLAVPVLKLLLYVLFYLFLSVVLEPVADGRFIASIMAAVKSGMLLVKILVISSALFIAVIAVTALATNHMGG